MVAPVFLFQDIIMVIILIALVRVLT
jgi:hypothetical protein